MELVRCIGTVFKASPKFFRSERFLALYFDLFLRFYDCRNILLWLSHGLFNHLPHLSKANRWLFNSATTSSSDGVVPSGGSCPLIFNINACVFGVRLGASDRGKRPRLHIPVPFSGLTWARLSWPTHRVGFPWARLLLLRSLLLLCS